jgi:hypothetical protein
MPLGLWSFVGITSSSVPALELRFTSAYRRATRGCSSVVERDAYTVDVGGSKPSARTTFEVLRSAGYSVLLRDAAHVSGPAAVGVDATVVPSVY